MQAFVYSWKNLTDGRLYIGWHKGQVDDGYVSSSPVFNEDYDRNPSNFSRTIIAHGSAEDMLNLEHQILKAVDAKNSSMFYNQSNGSSDFVLKKHSLKTKLKIAQSQRAIKNRKPLSDKAKANIAAGRRGRKHSAETIEKIRQSHIGKKHSPETIEKIRLASLSRSISSSG